MEVRGAAGNKTNIADRVLNLISSFIHNSNDDSAVASDVQTNKDASITNTTKRSAALVKPKASTSTCTVVAPPVTISSRHEAFIKRVERFTTLTWFGKPVSLSPVQCARYGWENTSRDILRCVHCREILCCQLPSPGDQKSYNDTVKDLQTKLIQSHRMNCSWRVNPCTGTNLSELVPDRSIAVEKFIARVASLQVVLELPSVNLTIGDSPLCVIDQLKQLLKDSTVPQMLGVGNDVSSSVCLIALCGWTIRPNSPAILTCGYCCRKVGVWKYLNKGKTNSGSSMPAPSSGVNGGSVASSNGGGESLNDGDSEPVTKRLKLKENSADDEFDPVNEHKYWCAWLLPNEQRNADIQSSVVGWKWYLYTLLPQLNPDRLRISKLVMGDVIKTPPHEGLKSVRHLFKDWISTDDLSSVKSNLILSSEKMEKSTILEKLEESTSSKSSGMKRSLTP